jgi:integrase
MIVVLWRAGLRIREALALAEHDLDHPRGSLLVRHGKGGRRREVGMDEWGWNELRPWLSVRAERSAPAKRAPRSHPPRRSRLVRRNRRGGFSRTTGSTGRRNLRYGIGERRVWSAAGVSWPST